MSKPIKYKKKNGETAYKINVYLGVDPATGKQRRTTLRGFKTAKAATLAEARLKVKIEKEGFNKQDKNKTFYDIFELWKVPYKEMVKESTYIKQLQTIKLHIFPHFKDRKVSAITPHECQQVISKWIGYYKHYDNLIGLTSRIIDHAVSLDLLDRNPMHKVMRPKKKLNIDEEPYSASFYTKEQLTQFLTCVDLLDDPKATILFRLLAYTGMRKGEILALRWRDVDLTNNIISVKQTLARGDKNRPIFQTPKTRASVRDITIDKETSNMLKRWRIQQRTWLLKHGHSKIDLVITNNHNRFEFLSYPNDMLKRIIKKYNLPHMTAHGFRHTHCSLLFEAGASIKDVQERLGHTNFKTTMEIYNHVTQEHKKETANKFAELMERSH